MPHGEIDFSLLQDVGRLRARGLYLTEIAKDLGIKYHELRRLVGPVGHQKRKNAKPKEQDGRYREMIRMRVNRKSLREIGERFDISYERVRQLLKGSGLERLPSKIKVPKPPKTTDDRFWEKVDRAGEDDCWIWKGCRARNGYGLFNIGKRRLYAHQYSWTLHNLSMPWGAFVCHRCSNPACVNPAHLYLGNAKTNARDRTKIGKSKGATLNRVTAEEIRRLSERGATRADLMRIYHVTYTTIYKILTYKSYR